MTEYQILHALAAKLSDALATTHIHPAYQNVWKHYRDSGLTYHGPMYFDELRKLREFLAANPPAPEQKTDDIPTLIPADQA